WFFRPSLVRSSDIVVSPLGAAPASTAEATRAAHRPVTGQAMCPAQTCAWQERETGKRTLRRYISRYIYLGVRRYITGISAREKPMLGAFFDMRDFGRNCGHGGPGSQRGRWGFEHFMGDFWGSGGPRGRGWKSRAGRIFEQGDLKYVILRLLAEKRRHGYEIIKELEDRFGGAYAPSPGTVYPTLTMLEDLGYARAMPEEGGRKIYEITDEGRKHLEEHSATVDDIFERIAKFVEGFF